MARERYINNSGYRFKDAGGWVWTEREEAAEAARRRAAQEQAATTALAETQAKIDVIQGDESLSEQEKIHALRVLTASGYGEEEFRVLRAAQGL